MDRAQSIESLNEKLRLTSGDTGLNNRRLGKLGKEARSQKQEDRRENEATGRLRLWQHLIE
jgi:hypothetical protein